MPITGLTRIIAVIGDPIDGARAPESVGAALASRQLDMVAVPVGIAAEGLAELVRAARSWRNLAGILVTMPHKEAIGDLVDHLSARARLTGAVNLVRRDESGQLWGDQIDGEGFVGSLVARDFELAGKDVVLLGAGGVARAIAFSLAAAGVASIAVVNRSASRARALVDDLAASFFVDVSVAEERAVEEADLVINATSVGSFVQPGLPIDPSRIRAGSIVADVVAKPLQTEFLIAAAERGAVTHSGDLMQRAQLHEIIEFTAGRAAAGI